MRHSGKKRKSVPTRSSTRKVKKARASNPSPVSVGEPPAARPQAPQRHAAEGPDAQAPECTDAQAPAGPEQAPEGPGAQVHEGPAEGPEEAPVRGGRGKGRRVERENSSPFPRSMRKIG